MSIICALIAPLGDKCTRRTEFLYAIILGVSYIDIPGDVDGNSSRIIELPVPIAVGPPFRDERAGGADGAGGASHGDAVVPDG